MTGHSRPLQLVNFDIEKAFDWVEHHIILQVLRAFGLLEIMIMTLQHYAAVGFTFCEVNGQKGIFIPIKTGSGQRNPVSVILLFLVATEPLNSLLATAFMELLYTTEE